MGNLRVTHRTNECATARLHSRNPTHTTLIPPDGKRGFFTEKSGIFLIERSDSWLQSAEASYTEEQS